MMKIIFLNCFSGQLLNPLIDFISEQRMSTNIFCFSEVSESLQKRFIDILPKFAPLFETSDFLTDCNELSGQSIFVKNEIKVINSNKIDIHKIKTDDIGFLFKLGLKVNDKNLFLGNVHGTSSPSDKKDSDIRIDQSKIIIDSFNDIEGLKIIGGDFNLLRDTKSIEMFETAGYKNLIKVFDVKATRNNVAWERFKNDPGFVKQFDSDYIFTSNDIKVKSFEVSNIEISDHLPLILEFEV